MKSAQFHVGYLEKDLKEYAKKLLEEEKSLQQEQEMYEEDRQCQCEANREEEYWSELKDEYDYSCKEEEFEEDESKLLLAF